MLIILAIGAVSANEDTAADEIVSQDSAEVPIAADSVDVEQTTDGVALASSDGDVVAADNRKNVSYEVYYEQYYVNDMESHSASPITVIWDENDATGYFSVSWGENGGFSMPIQYMSIDPDTHSIGPVSSLTFGQIFNEIEGPIEEGVTETVTIEYEGDSNYKPFKISHVFDVKYKGYMDLNTYEYGEIPTLYVYVPNYEGDAAVYINGKKFKDMYLENYEGGSTTLQKLNYGKNTITIELSDGGHISSNFTLYSEIHAPTEMDYSQDECISLNLPGGAKGNLFILLDNVQVFNQKVNGFTSYSLSDLPAGKYQIDAFYTGTDYEIAQKHSFITVYPNVTAPARVESGKDFNITVESGTSGNLIIGFYRQDWQWDEGEYVYKGDVQVGDDLVIGVGDERLTYTISDVPVIDNYYPDVYDNENCYPAVFMKYCWNTSTGELITVNRDLIARVLSDSPQTEITTNLKDYIFINTYLEIDVTLPQTAEGNVSFYVDGDFVELYELRGSYAYFYFDASELNIGNHTFEFRYTGDDYFDAVNYTKTVTLTAMGVYVPDIIHLKSIEAFMEVSFLDDMGGFFTVYLDDWEFANDFASKGFKSISLADLPMGTYDYRVVYCGDENNGNLTIEGTFVITEYDLYIDYGNDVAYGEDQVITVRGPDGIGGKITVKLYPVKDGITPSDIKTYEAPFVDGMAEITISNLSDKRYMFTAKFSGDDDCSGFYIVNDPESAQPNYFFFDMRYYVSVKCYLTPGENATVSVVAPEGVEAVLTVVLDGESEFSAPVENGIAEVTIPNLSYGNHYIEFTFGNGTEIFEEGTSDIFVFGELRLPQSSEWVIGDDVNVTLEMPADAVGTLKITEVMDDESEVLFKEVPVADGKAAISLKDLPLGGHYLNIRYTGTDYAMDPYENEWFRVKMQNPEIPSSINYGEDRYVDINIPPEVTGDVFLAFDDTEIKAVNNRVALSGLKPGSYEVYLHYNGDMSQYVGHMVVLKVTPVMNITVAYGNTGVEVTLPGDATGELIVDVEGDKYYGKVSDGAGVVKFDGFEPGEYYVDVMYSGDDLYSEAENSTILNVEKIIKKSTSIRLTMINRLDVTGVLKDQNGDYVANMEIVCIVGDERVVVKTNGKGEFTVKAKNNALLNMTFEGDPLYNGSNAVIMLKNLAPVQKATNIDVPTTMTKTAVDFNAGEKGTMFYFYLKDGDGKGVANKAVKIGIFDKIYTVKTDKNGRAGLQINIANANYYTYGISFLGDDDYKASFAVCSLQIVKKSVTITPAKTSYSFKTSAKTKTVTATLKSTNSYIPKGKQVTLTIAGKTFKATIGDKGQISFNIGSITAKGTYNVAIKFAGTNTYASATSKTISVKIS